MGLLYKIRIRIVNVLVFFFLVVLMPGLPPKTTFPFEGFSIPPLKELKGALELNNHLDNADRIFEHTVFGPEALLVRGEDIYATVKEGEVIRIHGPNIAHIAKFGKPCGKEFYEEEICGRPLGMAFDTQGFNLIVADAYYGIWLVDIETRDKTQLVSRDVVLDGDGVNRKPRLFNSVAVAKNGDIYWTESSSDFDLQDGIYTIFANPSGRLFHYDRKTKKNTLLLDRLYFANGVALSPGEDFVLVSETMSSQVHRIYLKGPKAGTTDIFVDGLPGLTDNLIGDDEGLWVPLVMAADEENPSLPRLLSKVPLIRKFLARMLALAEMPFRFLNQVMPNSVTQRLTYVIGHFETVSFANPDRVTIVRLDWNGNIVGSLHGFDRSVESISHVAEDEDSLYLGSPYNHYLARVNKPKVPKIRVQNVKFEPEPTTTKKPEVTTPAPTTTTTTTTTTTPKPSTTTTRKPASTTTTTTTPKPTTTTTTTTTTPKPATTPKPTTTTTSTTTAKPTTTTTTPKPTTTTTTPKPVVKPSPKPTTTVPTTTTITTPPPVEKEKPAASSTTTKPSSGSSSSTTEVPKPKKKKDKPTTTPTTTPAPEKPTVPAPIHEKIPNDTPKPQPDKLKVIKRGGEQGEL
ncbi:adipocyte plasma membrane-associated protein Hemomucin isoform X2 [Toxorhynchites rutilus septentrionalis]|uniref:adipocyte plasma membrane-associated protein Hemomucin isoform X2 n=1 Tax=Toxorhynchites rutilus septentrionalis TaxID=329112 RepID=UPI002479779B|nr:adipocyte plasma membrane-associated protein Hemomucin isoform X2 [Toxorhynchites rutilus septentrionalis]